MRDQAVDDIAFVSDWKQSGINASGYVHVDRTDGR